MLLAYDLAGAIFILKLVFKSKKYHKDSNMLQQAKFGDLILKLVDPKKGRDPQFENRCFKPLGKKWFNLGTPIFKVFGKKADK